MTVGATTRVKPSFEYVIGTPETVIEKSNINNILAVYGKTTGPMVVAGFGLVGGNLRLAFQAVGSFDGVIRATCKGGVGSGTDGVRCWDKQTSLRM